MTTAVIIPAYNEAATIREVTPAFHRELPAARIVIVDNNSGDDTRRLAADTLASLGRAVEFFLKKTGQGTCDQEGFSGGLLRGC